VRRCGCGCIGVGAVSCVHSLILLNNSLQVQVLSAQDLKFGQENRGGLRSGYGLCVGWWMAGLTTEVGGEVGGKRCRDVVGKV